MGKKIKQRFVLNATFSRPPVIHFAEGSANFTFVCIYRASILSAPEEDPFELFKIRPVGGCRKFNTSALQETSRTRRSTTHEREY